MYKMHLYKIYVAGILLLVLLMTSCTNPNNNVSPVNSSGTRDNSPVVREPAADGLTTYGSGGATIDASHIDQGYVLVNYEGSNPIVKLQITDPTGILYTYSLHGAGYETFPLTGGNGNYQFVIFENVSGDQYATAFSQSIDVSILNEYGPYLYPNQYVNFNSNSKTVAKSSELATGSTTDLEVVTNIYNYVIKNIKYDNAKATSVKSGYLPVVDEILESRSGICFDYAAVMATMLRSQDIPTRLEVGYAGTAYHAWISVHLDDLGWVNGIIEFDGTQWKLMDPTFASNNSESALKDFIGDGSKYQTKYIY